MIDTEGCTSHAFLIVVCCKTKTVYNECSLSLLCFVFVSYLSNCLFVVIIVSVVCCCFFVLLLFVVVVVVVVVVIVAVFVVVVIVATTTDITTTRTAAATSTGRHQDDINTPLVADTR